MKCLVAIFTLIFITSSQNINAQEITMFPGFWSMKYYQDDVQISKQEINSLMMQNKEAYELWQKSKTHETIAWLALGAELGFVIWGSTKTKNDEDTIVPLIGTIATAGVAIGFAFSSSSLKKKSILKYNQNLDIGSINLGPTHNGLGMVVSF